MKNKKWQIILALSLGLPSTILGVSALVYTLVQRKIISEGVGLLILLAVIANTFYLILRYANIRKAP